MRAPGSYGKYISPVFNKVLRDQGWPTTPKNARVFSVEDNTVIAAAQALALLAYLVPKEQIYDGPAHKFSGAILADLFRSSTSLGQREALPTWVSAIKPEAMRGRMRRGLVRLSHTFAALQTILEAVSLAEDKRARLAGERQTFSIRSSSNFSSRVITIPIQDTPHGPLLAGAVPDVRASSLRSAIVAHREAFGKGYGDEQEEYVNIYNRHVRPVFHVLALAMVVWESLMMSEVVPVCWTGWRLG